LAVGLGKMAAETVRTAVAAAPALSLDGIPEAPQIMRNMARLAGTMIAAARTLCGLTGKDLASYAGVARHPGVGRNPIARKAINVLERFGVRIGDSGVFWLPGRGPDHSPPKTISRRVRRPPIVPTVMAENSTH
jgi:hypothetical protein